MGRTPLGKHQKDFQRSVFSPEIVSQRDRTREQAKKLETVHRCMEIPGCDPLINEAETIVSKTSYREQDDHTLSVS